MSNQLLSDLSEQGKAHGSSWLRWLAPLIGKPGVVGLELGTWKGETAEWFLEHIFTSPFSSFATVDWFKGSDEHRLAGIDTSGNLTETVRRLERFKWRVEIAKMTTGEYLKARTAPIDFLYVDADHKAPSVLSDSVLGFELLRPGGFIVWDDYKWEVMKDEIDRPKIAIDGFLACYARRLEIVEIGGWQVCARKVA